MCTSADKGLHVTLAEGASFGEGALVTATRREATVTALSDCVLLQVRASALVGELGEALRGELAGVRAQITSQLLETTPFFRSLSKEQLRDLGPIMELEYYSAGQQIFAEGDAGDRFFILLEGRVDTHRTFSGARVEVRTYRPRDNTTWFGEMALMTALAAADDESSFRRRRAGAVRGAVASAGEAVKVLVVRSPHFSRFLEIVPTFGAMVKASHQAFAALNKMTARQHTIGDIQHDAMLAARRTSNGIERSFVASSLQRMQNWERVVAALLRAAKAAAKMAAKLEARAAARSPVGFAAVAT